MNFIKVQPVIEYEGDPGSSPRTEADFAQDIVHALRVYPHFVVLRGSPSLEVSAPIERLVRAIANTAPLKAGQTVQEGQKVSFTRVEINAEKAAKKTRVGTRYSRTNESLGLHTDGTYKDEPYELVVFQFARVDRCGGDTLMAAVEDIVANLDEEDKQALKKPDFPFGHDAYPILWEREGAPNIRYYRTQIDTACKTDDRLTERDFAAMDALDAVLRRDDILFRFHAEAGDTIFMHNTKVLHGRTSFASDSPRLMYRTRVAVGCLG